MPNKYKKDISIEILVGFFMFVILIALGVFTIVLSRQNLLKKTYPLEVRFENVGGLREGDHVYLRGTKVGNVKTTALENQYVVVYANLDVPVKFREGYRIEVTASSMLGGKLLKIYTGDSSGSLLPENAPVFGDTPIDMLDELATSVAEFKTLMSSVAAGEGVLGKLMTEEDLYDELKQITINFRKVSDRIAAGEGTLGKLLSEDDELYQDLRGAVDGIRKISEQIAGGEGTLGRLVEDDSLYVEAEQLLAELRAAIDDLRETSPVTTFSSVLFGAF